MGMYGNVENDGRSQHLFGNVRTTDMVENVVEDHN